MNDITDENGLVPSGQAFVIVPQFPINIIKLAKKIKAFGRSKWFY